MDDSEAFPRGKYSSTDADTPAKKKKLRKKKQKAEDGSDSEADKIKQTEFDPFEEQIQPLTYQYLVADMLLLACVSEISETAVHVDLPNALSGSVPVTEISDSFTKQLKSNSEVCPGADELVSRHQYLVCKVLEVEENKPARLTIKPNNINKHITANSLKAGRVIRGCISGVEDHGYTVDLGVHGVNSFCSTQDADSYIQTHRQGAALVVGVPVVTCVKRVTGKGSDRRTALLTLDPDSVKQAQDEAESGSSQLFPGMKTSCSVLKTSSKGVLVQCSGVKGRIHTSHLLQSEESYSTGDKLEVCVLAVHPVTKFVTFSMLRHLFTDSASSDKLQAVPIGSVVDHAEVKKVIVHKGVVFRLKTDHGTLQAFSPLRLLSDKKLTRVPTNYTPGTKFTARVVNVNGMDQLLQLSTSRSVIKQEFLSYGDIQLGSLLECKVESCSARGAQVMSGRLRGFIPALHLSDVPLKQPEVLYKYGKVVSCRVLSVNAERHQLHLTAKKSLVRSPLPQLCDVTEATRGAVYHGMVVRVDTAGLLVAFYGSAKGWVSRHQLSTQLIADPTGLYYIGQVVKCRVISADVDSNKMSLSLIMQDEKTKERKSEKSKCPLTVGQVVGAKVVSVTDDQLNVSVTAGSNVISAVVPLGHLSDHGSLCVAVRESMSAGSLLDKCVVLRVTKHRVLLSMKKSFVEAAETGSVQTDFSDIHVGTCLPVYVREVLSKGVLMDVLGGHLGFVPLRLLGGREIQLPDHDFLFPKDSSFRASVVEADESKQRLLLSLRTSDVIGAEESPGRLGLELLQDFVQSHAHLARQLSESRAVYRKLCDHVVGSVVKVTVTRVDEGEVRAVTDDKLDVAGKLATRDQELTCGCVEAVVVHVDLSGRQLIVSFDPHLLSAARTRTQSAARGANTSSGGSQVKPDQSLKTLVVHQSRDYVAVQLKGHAAGLVGYLPARNGLCDIREQFRYVLGQRNTAVVKQLVGDVIVMNLQLTETGTRNKPKPEEEVVTPPHVGDTLKLTVESISRQPLLLRLSSGRIKGRVHVSQLLDEDDPRLTSGFRPLSLYRVGSQLTVKLLGYRATRYKHKPATLQTGTPNPQQLDRVVFECSAKPSVVSSSTLPSVESRDLHVGDEVSGYVCHVKENQLVLELSPSVRGRVKLVNVSNDIETLQHVRKSFSVGSFYKARVIREPAEHVSLGLSLTHAAGPGPDAASGTAGQLRVCEVTSVTAEGLTVRAGAEKRGFIPVTELRDTYINHMTSEYHVGQLLHCVEIDRLTKSKKQNKSRRKRKLSDAAEEDTPTEQTVVVYSCRDSRLREQRRVKVQDEVIESAGDLSVDRLLRAFVKCCTNTHINLLVSHRVSGRLDRSELESHPSQHALTFTPGRLVSVRVQSVDDDDVKLSLAEPLEPEAVPKRKRRHSASVTSSPVKKRRESAETSEKPATKPAGDTSVVKEQRNEEEATSSDAKPRDCGAKMSSEERLKRRKRGQRIRREKRRKLLKLYRNAKAESLVPGAGTKKRARRRHIHHTLKPTTTCLQ